jgi:hypothetical protein
MKGREETLFPNLIEIVSCTSTFGSKTPTGRRK